MIIFYIYLCMQIYHYIVSLFLFFPHTGMNQSGNTAVKGLKEAGCSCYEKHVKIQNLTAYWCKDTTEAHP